MGENPRTTQQGENPRTNDNDWYMEFDPPYANCSQSTTRRVTQDWCVEFDPPYADMR